MNDMTPMEPQNSTNEKLLDLMPPARGRLRENADLSKVTWFQVGGPADILFKPEDDADLAEFLKNLPGDIPVHVIGVGSNLLVRDAGVRGVVIRLGRHFAKMNNEGDKLTVGAGALDGHVARFAADAGLEGAEFLSGIPGGIGGALRMNAGAYGADISDIFLSAVAYDRKGQRHELSLKEMGFSYRHTDVPKDWIFTEATFRLTPGDRQEILDRMADISRNREESQPIRSRTGGSTFANPPGKKAWELIDDVGGRGFSIGDAMVSEKHCNFLINKGAARAADLEAVGEELRRRVFAKHDTLLRWEIVRLGDAGERMEGADS
ncbi:UDP-N-acetylmuramate dehydrogenase [Sneathiella sp. CAU 1612]|uniref:UDP-N-acetylenolpyruvoylglucosamine reductase n=2 Tax=Sneathiella sedimenti TaxID=2816034 RepID=A0ABS3F3E1_9PROT|nr:UDP-N-acetylmuramate dehydrogenase [Sneathiella sedimenti]MBO0333035.1 UDP-N-acetylmuramate dehydrogenase [Sneathiella sedimenti]